MHLTRAEAALLVIIILEYMKLVPDFLESNIDIITNTETRTDEVLKRLVEFTTRVN